MRLGPSGLERSNAVRSHAARQDVFPPAVTAGRNTGRVAASPQRDARQGRGAPARSYQGRSTPNPGGSNVDLRPAQGR